MEQPPKPVLKVNPEGPHYVPPSSRLSEAELWARTDWRTRGTTSWWGRLLERLRFGRHGRRGLLFAAPVDEPSCRAVSTGITVGPLSLDPDAPPRPPVPHDGYREYLRTLPDLTVGQIMKSNEAAQLVALVGIADPEQRAGFWAAIRLRWFFRRLWRRLGGKTWRGAPRDRLQRRRDDA